MKNRKIIQAIPGIIVGSIMTGIIIWGISSDYRCKQLLKKDNCITKMVFCKYSEVDLRGASTAFIDPNDTSSYFTTYSFKDPIPKELPIIVRYSAECKECYEFLWDSVINYHNYRIRYFSRKNNWRYYEIKK